MYLLCFEAPLIQGGELYTTFICFIDVYQKTKKQKQQNVVPALVDGPAWGDFDGGITIRRVLDSCPRFSSRFAVDTSSRGIFGPRRTDFFCFCIFGMV